MRVLIVEDNRDTARTLQLLLRRFGYEAHAVFTGRAGAELARLWRPDVLICDLGLPEMDGYEVAAALRRDPVMADTWLIAVSGYGSPEHRTRSRAAGFDLHLTKPVNPVDLQRLLDEGRAVDRYATCAAS
jgi:CheY-like chemotaxis protein